MEKIKSVTKICEKCGKEFTETDTWRIKNRAVRFCSNSCRTWKNDIDHHYFKKLDEKKLHTLGQILSIGSIEYDGKFIMLSSSEETLSKILSDMSSNYTMKKWSKVFKVKVESKYIISDLLSLGMIYNPLYQDIPRDDLLSGVLDTHLYTQEGGINYFRTDRSKIARWVCDKVNGVLETKLYRQKDKFCLCMEYIVKWK